MKRHTEAEVKVSTKGRITRPDQAWNAAHREAIERSRIVDIDLAHEDALREADEAQSEAETDAHDAGRSNVVPFVRVEHDEPQAVTTGPALVPTHSLAVPLKYITSALLVAAKGDIRYYLNGIYIHAVDDEVRICSTDGHRLVVSRFEPGKDLPIPEWARAGIIIPRDELAQALPVLSKNAVTTEQSIMNVYRKHRCDDGIMFLDFGAGHDLVTLRCANDFAAFRVKPVDGKFPDYAKVLAGSAASLARGDGDPMATSAIATAYLRSAGDVAMKLGAKAIHSFIGADDGKACFFTFDGAPDTVLVIMPMRAGEAVSSGVVKLIGRDGVQASISALKAHVTRTVMALESSEGKVEREALEARKEGFEARIAQLLAATASGPKQIEHRSPA